MMKLTLILLFTVFGLIGCFPQQTDGIRHGGNESEESIEYMAELASDLSEHVFDDSGFFSVTACETPNGISQTGTSSHTVTINNCTDSDGNTVTGVLHVAWDWSTADNGTFAINNTPSDSHITVSGVLDVGMTMTAEFSGIEVNVTKTGDTKIASVDFAATWDINGEAISFSLETLADIELDADDKAVAGVVQLTDNRGNIARVTFVPNDKTITFY